MGARHGAWSDGICSSTLFTLSEPRARHAGRVLYPFVALSAALPSLSVALPAAVHPRPVLVASPLSAPPIKRAPGTPCARIARDICCVAIGWDGTASTNHGRGARKCPCVWG